jgi:hypothetical protein
MSIYLLVKEKRLMSPSSHSDMDELVQTIVQQMDLSDPVQAFSTLMTLATTLNEESCAKLSDSSREWLVVSVREIIRTLSTCGDIRDSISPDFVFFMENVVGEGAGSMDWSAPDISMMNAFQIH